MRCFDDHEIDRWVMGAAVPTEAWQHLFDCDLCRRAFLFQSAWQAQFNTLASFSLLQQVEKRVLELLPLQDSVKTQDSEYRLAAEGGVPTDVYTVMSFSSPEHNVVGRILQDSQSKRITLHLIAEDPELVKGVKVRLVGPELDGHTDLWGCIDFGPLTDFHCSAVHVQSPLATFDLSAHSATEGQAHTMHSFVIKNQTHDEIQIDIDQETAKRQYRFVMQRIAGEPAASLLQIIAVTDVRVIPAQNCQGAYIVETEGMERVLKIHVY
jgi:hypothetical protein